MKEIILAFLGAGIGGVIRMLLGSFIYSYTGKNFPYGTLIINLTGSFAIGFMFILISQKFLNSAPQLTAFVLIGVLGGYTTFSTFSFETFYLLEEGKIGYALINIIVSVGLGLVLTWLGLSLGKKFI